MCNQTETTTVSHFFRGFDVLTTNTSPLDPVNFTIFDHVVCCWPFTFLSFEAGVKGLTFFSSSLSPICFDACCQLQRRLLFTDMTNMALLRIEPMQLLWEGT